MTRHSISLFVAGLILFGQGSAIAAPPSETHRTSVIPRPMKMTVAQGNFAISPDTRIAADAEFQQVGRDLSELMRPATGYAMPVENATAASRSGTIVLKKNASLAETLGLEGYRLVVAPGRATVEAPSAAGAFYGCQTIRQLLPPEAVGQQKADSAAWSLPCVEIVDRPRFPWRGLMLDCSRTFQSIDYLKKTIRVMALFKMNVLHLHLTDDQGWRMEIKKYPRLTQVGAKFDPKFDEPKSCEGYYTQDEMRSLVAYAARRHITIVPEIEMPGHCFAALVSYPDLSCRSGPFGGIGSYFKDKHYHEDVFCAGDERTFTFLEDVLGEVLAVFPGKYIHIGGDEAKKIHWDNCPKCQQRIAREGLKNSRELQSYFVKRIECYLNSRGRTLIGWDEILQGGLAPRAVVMSWRGTKGGIAAAKAGHDVVMTPNRICYFNYDVATLQRVFSYDPVPAELTAAQAQHVLGVQACFWSHIQRTPDGVDGQLYPRLLALAETAWSAKDGGSFDDFTARLSDGQQRLSLLQCKPKAEKTDSSAISGESK